MIKGNNNNNEKKEEEEEEGYDDHEEEEEEEEEENAFRDSKHAEKRFSTVKLQKGLTSVLFLVNDNNNARPHSASCNIKTFGQTHLSKK